MPLTITVPGSVLAEVGATAPAILTIGLGPVGPVGPGVAIGGTTGQVLRKLSGTNYDTGWLTLGTMASAATADYSTTAQAGALYYPLSGNPSAFLTASALTPYLTSATAAATYYLQSNPSAYISGVAWGAITGTLSTQTDLQSALDLKYDASNPSAYITASELAPYATIDAPTFTGVVTIPSGATIGSSVNIGVYATLGNDASTVTQANNDNSTRLATTAFVKNQSYLPTSSAASSYFTIASAANKADLASPALSGVPTGPTATAGTSSTQLATTAFVTTADNLKAPLASPTFTGTVTIPSGASISGYLLASTAASTYYLQTNPSAFITSSALTPYLMTSTAASIYAPLASPSLSGVPTGPTAGISDNSSQLATTAYVKGQGYITTNVVTSVAGRTGAVVLGIADVSGAAPLASPTLTGTPLSTTAVADTNTTQIATTAFVIGQASALSPIMDSVAAVGTAVKFARADHVHPTDTSRSALASPTFSGTPSLPTGTIGVTQVAGNSTTALATTAFVTTADNLKANLAGPTFTGVVTLPTGTVAVTQTAADSTTAVATTAFVTTADALKANIASPSLTGTPLSTTAVADTSTTQIATTAFVTGQASATTPTAAGVATIGTSLKFARADHIHPTDTTRAALASPAFTGTPSLPTGTTGITQTAGNNTTALATTAFVTTAVPAIATLAQVNSPTLDTVVMTPDKVRQMMMFQGNQQFLVGGSTATAGVGSSAPNIAARWRQCTGPMTLTAGYASFAYDTSGSGLGYTHSTRGGLDFQKRLYNKWWMSARTSVGNTGYAGDAQTLYRCELGGRSSPGAGDPVLMSIGWKVAGGGSSAIIFYVRTEATVNGGTYTEATSSFTPSTNLCFDWMMTYNAGSAKLYVNDTLVATITATISTNQNIYNLYLEQVEQTATAAVRFTASSLPNKVFFAE